MDHFKNTLILVSAMMVGTIIMHELHIVPWPAFLAVIFYFLFDFDNSKLKMIFSSGVMGLAFGYAFTFLMPAAIQLMGPSLGYYVVLGTALVIVLGLSTVAPTAFNPLTFTYGLLSLLNIQDARAESFTWLITLLILGGFIIMCVHLSRVKLIATEAK
ncbi:hypothetical protein ACPV4B_21155 [Vibrio parahaemolyticus]|uniref:hypothetical protein n=1 Tax=Vibrio mediterranei TaxID=689 RepID=UPI004068CEB2